MIGAYHYVTIASDASVSNRKENHKAGFAYYIRDDDGTVKYAWSLQEKHTSTIAELMAILGALEEVNKKEYPKNTKLIYYCDNQTALQVLMDDFAKPRSRKRWLYYIERFKQLTKQFESVDARHVPAHTNKDSEKKYYLNRWVDFNARAMMRHGRLHVVRSKITNKEKSNASKNI